MSHVMEGRLGILITLIIFVVCLYISEAFVIQAQADVEGRQTSTINTGTFETTLEKENLDDYRENTPKDEYNETTDGTRDAMTGLALDFFSILFGLASFLSFTAISGMPVYMSLILSIITTVCYIVIGYIIWSIVYDNIKALPFT